MTLDNAFKELNTLGLTYEQHQALITLVGKFGRDEYARGYTTAAIASQHYYTEQTPKRKQYESTNF